jgi:SSS family solute:Na+ symporter
MTGLGWWIIGLAVGYTVLLLGLGKRANRGNLLGSGYFVGGRSFRTITVAVCITGLFSGSSFIAITELSYQTGISALWYGVAETVQVILIALLLIGPLRERLVVTVSGLVGDRFGRGPRALAGAITAITFPMWSVATAIAFASALHVFTGLSIQTSVIVTALLLLGYLWFGGMRSVALTQGANTIVFALMVVIGLIAVTIDPGWAAIGHMLASQPRYGSLTGVGSSLIIAWFGTFIVNVILAQATFQMALSCKTAKEGRRGLLAAAGFGLPLLFLGVILGVAAAIVVPGERLGLVAVARYVADALPTPIAGVFFLGIWACALGWGAPCQFSGATSFGRDVGTAIRPAATEVQQIRWTRWSLIGLTVLMIIFGFLRTDQSAWWNVLAWTLRNGATLAPVIAALFWPLATRKAVYAALSTGFASGLIWYYLGDWQAQHFFAGVHPVWIGMGTNLIALLSVTLLQTAGRSALASDPRRRLSGAAAMLGAVLLAAVTVWTWHWSYANGLAGLLLFTILALLTVAAFAIVVERPAPALRGSREAGVSIGAHGHNDDTEPPIVPDNEGDVLQRVPTPG